MFAVTRKSIYFLLSFFVTKYLPLTVDHPQTEDPFPLQHWLTSNRSELDSEGSKRLFDFSYQSDVVALGEGSLKSHNPRAETFLWQIVSELRMARLRSW